MHTWSRIRFCLGVRAQSKRTSLKTKDFAEKRSSEIKSVEYDDDDGVARHSRKSK
jgi:hypothetical protein